MVSNHTPYKVSFYCYEDYDQLQDWYLHSCEEYVLGKYKNIYQKVTECFSKHNFILFFYNLF